MQRFPLKCLRVLCGVTVFILGFFAMQIYHPARGCAVLSWPSRGCGLRVSTGGSGEKGGTVYSVEMRHSLVCSGTGKTPERCFGNSGGNWSADNLTA